MPDPHMLIANLNEDTQVFSQSPAGDRSLTNASQQSIGGLMIPTSNNSFVGGPVGGFDLFSVHGDSGPGTTKVPAQLLDEDDLGLDLGLDMDMPDVESSVNPSIRQPRGPTGIVDRTESVNAGDRFASEQPGQPMVKAHIRLSFIHMLTHDSSDKMTMLSCLLKTSTLTAILDTTRCKT